MTPHLSRSLLGHLFGSIAEVSDIRMQFEGLHTDHETWYKSMK